MMKAFSPRQKCPDPLSIILSIVPILRFIPNYSERYQYFPKLGAGSKRSRAGSKRRVPDRSADAARRYAGLSQKQEIRAKTTQSLNRFGLGLSIHCKPQTQ